MINHRVLSYVYDRTQPIATGMTIISEADATSYHRTPIRCRPLILIPLKISIITSLITVFVERFEGWLL